MDEKIGTVIVAQLSQIEKILFAMMTMQMHRDGMPDEIIKKLMKESSAASQSTVREAAKSFDREKKSRGPTREGKTP